MNNKFQEIRDIFHYIGPSVLCLQEGWGKNEQTDYSIRNYQQPNILARPGVSMNLGGVAIWVNNNLHFLPIKSPFKSKQFESACISIPDKKTPHLKHLSTVW